MPQSVGSVLWALRYTDLAQFTFLDQQNRAVSTKMAVNNMEVAKISLQGLWREKKKEPGTSL